MAISSKQFQQLCQVVGELDISFLLGKENSRYPMSAIKKSKKKGKESRINLEFNPCMTRKVCIATGNTNIDDRANPMLK